MKQSKIFSVIRTILSFWLFVPLIACADNDTTSATVIETAQAPQKQIEKLAVKGESGAEKVKLDASNSAASVKTFQKDVHYVEFFSQVPVSTNKDEIEVVDMFWYGCPHCFQLEPHLDKWQKNTASDIKVVPMPGVLNPAWKLHAKAFYAAEVMGVSEKFHHALFQTIHKQGRKIRNQDALIRFIERQGIDAKEFESTMDSMAVAAKVARAEQLGKQYGVTGVPALMVGGKYRILGSGVRSYEEMFEVVDFLAEKIRKEQ